MVHHWAHSIFLSTLCASGLRSSHGVALVMGCPALVVRDGPCCCCCWGCCCPNGTSCPGAGCAPKLDWPPKGEGAALLLGAPQLKAAPADCGALPATGSDEASEPLGSSCCGQALCPSILPAKEAPLQGEFRWRYPLLPALGGQRGQQELTAYSKACLSTSYSQVTCSAPMLKAPLLPWHMRPCDARHGMPVCVRLQHFRCCTSVQTAY